MIWTNDLDHEQPHDECGIFGVIDPNREDVARTTFFGLYNLQHRGQESAGIAVSNGAAIQCHKAMGLVNQVFSRGDLERLPGHISLGHTRYSTTGSSVIRNAQPIVVETEYGPLAVAHNGNIVNTMQLRKELEREGVQFESSNDSEVLARCLASRYSGNIVDAVRDTMNRVQGAYSVGVLTRERLVGFRDPNGIRPLCVAELGSGGYVISSETCALPNIDARFACEIEPGQMAEIDLNGFALHSIQPTAKKAMCLFEFIYLARPDSQIYGKGLHAARIRMGQALAEHQPAPGATMVIPVPDTGIPAAIGFSRCSGIPYGEGLIKNRYIGRTFIEPDQRLRELGVRMKLSPLRDNVAGQKVVLVDDSIVRGTTTGQIVRLLREAGAHEVHVRISAPPVRYPCFYGIDMADQADLIAARLSVKQICRRIGANSLGYLTLEQIYKAIGVSSHPYCTACFNGQYPVDVPADLKLTKFALEKENGHTTDLTGLIHLDSGNGRRGCLAEMGDDGGDPSPSILGVEK